MVPKYLPGASVTILHDHKLVDGKVGNIKATFQGVKIGWAVTCVVVLPNPDERKPDDVVEVTESALFDDARHLHKTLGFHHSPIVGLRFGDHVNVQLETGGPLLEAQALEVIYSDASGEYDTLYAQLSTGLRGHYSFDSVFLPSL